MIQNSRENKLARASLITFVGLVMALWGNSALAQSQIIPDATMGNENSQVRTNVNIKNIPSEVIEGGAQREANLFHSFSEFNISEGRGAYFANPGGIEHIFSRVTGANPSEILGTLGVLGNANLFLINPNGIIFGGNARLDVGGSFVGTTADGVSFGEQGFFSATEPNSPPLLTVSPSAFFFNQIQPGRIENQSIASAGVNLSGEALSGLRVPNGESLLLVGGDIDIDGGGLYALGGRVELGSLAATGNVELDIDSNNLSLNFPVGVGRADISLTNGAKVDVTAAGGGSIAVNANNLDMSGASLILAGIERNQGSPDAQAGDINLNIIEKITASQASNIRNEVNQNSIGDAGNIKVQTGSLALKEGSLFIASTRGKENAGLVEITAQDTITFDRGSGAFSQVAPEAEGDAGGVKITTGSLSLTNGGAIDSSTFGRGDAGLVEITAQDTITFDGEDSNGIPSGAFSRVNLGAEGDAGGVKITTGSLALTKGGTVSSSTLGQGNAGLVEITAQDTITFDGEDSDGFASGATSLVNRGAEGNAGGVKITTSSLFLTNGGRVDSSTLGKGNAGLVEITAQDTITFDGERLNDLPSAAVSQVNLGAEGDAGGVKITTGSLALTNGGQVNSITFGKGNAGLIEITAQDTITFDGESSDGSSSSAVSAVAPEAEGDAEGVKITTGSLSLTKGGAVNTSSFGKGDAGLIEITAQDTITFDGERSNGLFSGTVSVVAPEAEGDAGGVKITTGSLSLTNGGRIDSSTFGKGDAGLIEITTQDTITFDGESSNGLFLSGAFSQVNLAEAEGDAGGVKITTGSLSLTNGGRIDSSTLGKGNARLVEITAKDTITIDGENLNGIPSAALSAVAPEAEGDAGGVKITTGSLSLTNGGRVDSSTFGQGNARLVEITTGSLFLTNGGQVNAGSLGQGDADDIFIRANSIALENGSSLEASTSVNTGGNITLLIADNLTLRDKSKISAQANNDATGGNVTINADFIIASFNQDNDIIARATEGKGGTIDITTEGIFGLKERKADPPNNTNDIDASSDFGSQGTVEINTPEVDPNRGLIQLPTQPLETEVAQACAPGSSGQSEFFITGRGGLPPDPTETLSSDAIGVDLVTLDSDAVEEIEGQGDWETRRQGRQGDTGTRRQGRQGDTGTRGHGRHGDTGDRGTRETGDREKI